MEKQTLGRIPGERKTVGSWKSELNDAQTNMAQPESSTCGKNRTVSKWYGQEVCSAQHRTVKENCHLKLNHQGHQEIYTS